MDCGGCACPQCDVAGSNLPVAPACGSVMLGASLPPGALAMFDNRPTILHRGYLIRLVWRTQWPKGWRAVIRREGDKAVLHKLGHYSTRGRAREVAIAWLDEYLGKTTPASQ